MADLQLNLGKNGVSDEFIKDLKSHIEREKTVKVKVLKSGMAGGKIRDVVSKVKSKLKCRISGVRGHTFIVEKF